MELTCQELVELVTDYLENTLTSEARVAFDEHLEECKNCSHYLEQIRHTIQIVGKLSEDNLDPEARRELLIHFRHWKKGD